MQLGLVWGYWGAGPPENLVSLTQEAERLGYDTVWGYAGRPDWIANARSYEFVDASSRSLADMVAERRQRLIDGEEAFETATS